VCVRARACVRVWCACVWFNYAHTKTQDKINVSTVTFKCLMYSKE